MINLPGQNDSTQPEPRDQPCTECQRLRDAAWRAAARIDLALDSGASEANAILCEAVDELEAVLDARVAA